MIRGVPIEMVPIDDLIPHPRNPRIHADPEIVASIQRSGFYGAVVRQKSTGYLLVGNGRTAAAKVAGLTELPTQTLDLPDTEATRLLLRDNRLSDLASYDEESLVATLKDLALEPGSLEGTAWSLEDLLAYQQKLAANEDGDEEEEEAFEYTRKTDAVHYQMTGDKPPVESLVERDKTNDLMERITAADVPEDVREFLTAAAQRHLVFDYSKIAEFYAHADPELQALMEASALVIVDWNDAVHHGFVRLSSRLADILKADLALQAESGSTGRVQARADA